MKNVLKALLLLCSTCAFADDVINAEKPFAEKHLLLQVSDKDPAKFNSTLNIAGNLIRHYGSTDTIDIQVITFAGGVNLLRAENNPNAGRIRSLMSAGIDFKVCLNTLDTIERNTGKRPKVIEGTGEVRSGVAHMLDEIERGYTHIKP